MKRNPLDELLGALGDAVGLGGRKHVYSSDGRKHPLNYGELPAPKYQGRDFQSKTRIVYLTLKNNQIVDGGWSATDGSLPSLYPGGGFTGTLRGQFTIPYEWIIFWYTADQNIGQPNFFRLTAGQNYVTEPLRLGYYQHWVNNTAIAPGQQVLSYVEAIPFNFIRDAQFDGVELVINNPGSAIIAMVGTGANVEFTPPNSGPH